MRSHSVPVPRRTTRSTTSLPKPPSDAEIWTSLPRGTTSSVGLSAMAYTGDAAASCHGASRRCAPVRRNAGPNCSESAAIEIAANAAVSARTVTGRSSIGTAGVLPSRRAASARTPCSSIAECPDSACGRNVTAVRTAPPSCGTRSSRYNARRSSGRRRSSGHASQRAAMIVVTTPRIRRAIVIDCVENRAACSANEAPSSTMTTAHRVTATPTAR